MMFKNSKIVLTTSKEVLFQIALHLVVFIFYSFDKEQPQIEPSQVVTFLNYALATLFISYVLLPRLLYKKRHLQFFAGVIFTIACVILVEELIIEKIYFPDTRGQGFPGVFYSLLDVLPVITILSGFKFAWDALVKQQEVEKLKAAVKESELQFLKSQINPHFLFNNLNNLYAHAIENSPKTPTIILELSSVLRYMLYECRERYVPLTKEIEQLRNFTQLYELQIGDRGVVHFTTQNIQPGYRIAPLILIVFIENAFKHSQAGQADNIFIEIDIQLSENGLLDFFCSNTFQRNTNTEKLNKGIGLENVKKRLKLLYPGAHRLNIQETENMFEVHLSLKLNGEEEVKNEAMEGLVQPHPLS